MRTILITLTFGFLILGCGSSENSKTPASTLTQATLGAALFSDANLSANRTQSCATCHNPEHGFADNRSNDISGLTVSGAVSLGDDGVSIGDRNAPTAAYASFIPAFSYDSDAGRYVGGQFLDGRASKLEDQAGGPPLNPLEMGMASKADVVARIQENDTYVTQFKRLFGESIFDDANATYEAMKSSIAAFERTDTFAPFDSKYDRYLACIAEDRVDPVNECLEEGGWTTAESLGMDLFFSESNTNCSLCHMINTGLATANETFSNYQYHNIGVPSNPTLLTHWGSDFNDSGLANHLGDEDYRGMFKVPTLRNVAVTGPYMHNGVFADLETVVRFYDHFVSGSSNTINPETGVAWADPETDQNISTTELTSATTLNDTQVAALVAFLKTLTDQRYEHLLGN